MQRINVKLDRTTHRRLHAALPELSAEAGRMFTISEAIEYLMAQHRQSPLARAGVPAVWPVPTDDLADARP